ncbi:MAG: diphosphomevalonate decarboxylase [Deltaproteobacteria bacterium]|nr:MAG: diphosphomevalonate decarboxylase [Deltaproteobacteria bacterium]
MNTATARAHANIALVKYWGKRDTALNLPAVSSLSLTLDRFWTETTVTPAEADGVYIAGEPAAPKFAARALSFVDELLPGRDPVRIDTHNSFPTGAGLASSASGFAALTLAAAHAGGLDLSTEALSAWARRGSGSACRSLWGGFVTWRKGEADDGSDSHGTPLAGPEHWDLRMLVAVVASGPKPIGSTAAMERTRDTSPYYGEWLATSEADVDEAEAAVRARDLPRLGEVMESSTFKMHATMHTARPMVNYWQPGTLACIHAVHALREQGVGAWLTMDAGPNVKVLCAPGDADRVAAALAPHVERVERLGPGPAPTLS